MGRSQNADAVHHPRFSDYLARARKVAGDLERQVRSGEVWSGVRTVRIAADAVVRAMVTDNFKQGQPQVHIRLDVRSDVEDDEDTITDSRAFSLFIHRFEGSGWGPPLAEMDSGVSQRSWRTTPDENLFIDGGRYKQWIGKRLTGFRSRSFPNTLHVGIAPDSDDGAPLLGVGWGGTNYKPLPIGVDQGTASVYGGDIYLLGGDSNIATTVRLFKTRFDTARWDFEWVELASYSTANLILRKAVFSASGRKAVLLAGRRSTWQEAVVDVATPPYITVDTAKQAPYVDEVVNVGVNAVSETQMVLDVDFFEDTEELIYLKADTSGNPDIPFVVAVHTDLYNHGEAEQGGTTITSTQQFLSDFENYKMHELYVYPAKFDFIPAEMYMRERRAEGTVNRSYSTTLFRGSEIGPEDSETVFSGSASIPPSEIVEVLPLLNLRWRTGFIVTVKKQAGDRSTALPAELRDAHLATSEGMHYSHLSMGRPRSSITIPSLTKEEASCAVYRRGVNVQNMSFESVLDEVLISQNQQYTISWLAFTTENGTPVFASGRPYEAREPWAPTPPAENTTEIIGTSLSLPMLPGGGADDPGIVLRDDYWIQVDVRDMYPGQVNRTPYTYQFGGGTPDPVTGYLELLGLQQVSFAGAKWAQANIFEVDQDDIASWIA